MGPEERWVLILPTHVEVALEKWMVIVVSFTKVLCVFAAAASALLWLAFRCGGTSRGLVPTATSSLNEDSVAESPVEKGLRVAFKEALQSHCARGIRSDVSLRWMWICIAAYASDLIQVSTLFHFD